MGGHKDKSSNDIPVPPPPPPYPGHYNGRGEKQNYAPPTYAYSSMHSNPYGAHAAHVPARFPAEVKPGIFNIWGIQGYTGSVDTSTNLSPEETYCSLAKIQQSMTGHNQFDPFKFAKAATDTKLEEKTDNKDNDDSSDSDDSDSDNDDDIKKIPRPPTPDTKKYHRDQFNFVTYAPAHPGYGNYTYGLPPPPCASKKKEEKHDKTADKDKKDKKRGRKDRKGKKEDNKCEYCAGVSGHPVKKIKKLDGKPLCWACVWRTYTHAAQEVWEESEDVKVVSD